MRHVLITGASSGIGLELAKVCAQNGHDLVLVARGRSRLEAIAADFREIYNVQVAIIDQDLAQPDAAEEVVKKLKKGKLSIDVLINNAGLGLGGPFIESDLDRIRELMEVNMVAVTLLGRLILPNMVRDGGGRVMNVASTAAFYPGPFMSVYYASKAYVLSLSVALGEELRDSGVTVTALCPGPTQSHFADQAGATNARLFRGRLTDASTVAKSGYEGMMAGRAVVIPGRRSKLAAFITKALPYKARARLARKANEVTS